MGVNKVTLNTPNGEEIVVDFSNDTVTADTLLAGVTAHGADGEPITGTLEAGGVSDIDLEAGILYRLPETKVFNGTSDYIDTGVKLYDQPRDYTIFVDCTFTGDQVISAPIFNCLSGTTNGNGISLAEVWGNGHYGLIGDNSYGGVYSYRSFPYDGTRGRIIVTAKNGIAQTYRFFAENSDLPFGGWLHDNTFPATPVTKNMFLGAAQNWNGTMFKFWHGTMYDFGVWDRVLSPIELAYLLALPDEKPNDAYMRLILQKNAFEISIPKNTKTVGSNALISIGTMFEIYIHEGVEVIGDYAIANAMAMRYLTLPASITTLNARAFNNCQALREVTFEGTPTTIISTAFGNCGSLTTINVPWAEGAVANAPWGATNATINYNYTG